jgi:hypothetical protein
MNKDQLDQKGNQGTPQGNQPMRGQPQKHEQHRQDSMPGGQKRSQSGPEGSQRDQLDDEGRQRHMGHGAKDDQGRDRPLEEGDQDEEIGRPVRAGEGDPNGGENDRKRQTQWDDETEGTSR